MYQSLDLFQTASAMARHAGSRQAEVARNIAHADTPGYTARHLAPFTDIYDTGQPTALRTTRQGHIAGDHQAHVSTRAVQAALEPAPNGNTVSLEHEMLLSVEVGREHDRALAIYRHAMTVLRTSLGRG